MKPYYYFILLIVLLFAACRSAGDGSECLEGVCLDLKIEEPVQAEVPAKYTITVRSDKDISQLYVGLNLFNGISLSRIENQPTGANLVYQDQRLLEWMIDAENGVEYSFTGYIVLQKPDVSYGIFRYMLGAQFSNSQIGRNTTEQRIYLDAEGKQVPRETAIELISTGWPLPTTPPDRTLVPVKPFPTPIWPTATPSPTATTTPIVYPLPTENIEGQPAQTPAYPSP